MAKKILKRTLQEGEVIVGLGIRSFNPVFVEVAGIAGVDFVFLDMEHTPVSWETLEQLVMVADAANIPSGVRVEQNNDSLIRKALEIGFQMVLVPHVNTKEETIRAVQAAKFPPEGIRGAIGALRRANYGVKDWPAFIKRSNEESLVAILIEDVKAMDNLDEILSVEGLDAVCFGATDFSLSMGRWDVAGQRDHPEVKEAFETLIDKCKEYGVHIWYSPPARLEVVKEWLDKGVTIFTIGSDLGAFNSLCKRIVEDIVVKIK